MALRQAYSLINSEFNAFLFAPIGEEENGMVLSVFSALARLDIDPWKEAARLTDLSKEKAVHALEVMIAGIPGERWTSSDIRAIASRLVAFLPRRTMSVPAGAARVVGIAKPNSWIMLLAITLALVVAALFFARPGYHLPWSDEAPSPDISRTSRDLPR